MNVVSYSPGTSEIKQCCVRSWALPCFPGSEAVWKREREHREGGRERERGIERRREHRRIKNFSIIPTVGSLARRWQWFTKYRVT